MIITIFGATGQVGKRAIEQALAKGFIVKAFSRNIENLIDKDLHTANFHAIKGHVFDEEEVLNAVKGSNAVISVLGGSFEGLDKTRSLGIKNIVTQMQKADVKRIVALGGMGILNADEHTLIIDTPEYPQMYLAVGREHQEAYEYLKASSLDWTFVCSPDILNEAASCNYVTNADYLPIPNLYKIAAGDLADFMLKELTQNKFVKHRVGISKM